jgi:hypothetical protein
MAACLVGPCQRECGSTRPVLIHVAMVVDQVTKSKTMAADRDFCLLE